MQSARPSAMAQAQMDGSLATTACAGLRGLTHTVIVRPDARKASNCMLHARAASALANRGDPLACHCDPTWAAEPYRYK